MFMFVTYIPEEVERKRGELYTEADYYSRTTPYLLSIDCPNCGTSSSLYIGFYYIGCKACMNLALTVPELERYMLGSIYNREEMKVAETISL